MIIPYNVDVPMQRWPFANWAIIGLTSTVALALFANPEEVYGSSTWVLRRGDGFDPLGLVGHLFTHGNVIHLAGNMFFLFCFGNAVNAKVGHYLFVPMYFGLGALQGLIWVLLGSHGAGIGASGAVMAIMGAFLVFYPRNDVSVFYWFGIWGGGSFNISAYWVVGAYVLLDLFGVVSKSDGVGHASHLLGAGLGAATAAGLLLAGLVKPAHHEHTLLQVVGLQKKTAEQLDREEKGRARRSVPAGPVAPIGTRLPPHLRGRVPTSPAERPPIPLAGDEPAPTSRPKPAAPPRRPPTAPPGR